MALRLEFDGETRVLRTGQLFVGRSPDSHIVLSDEGASRRHAVFTMGRSGAFVSDLSSKLGVFLNGEPIKQTMPLVAGDTIYIAGLWITVEEAEVDDDDEPTDPRLRSTVSPPAMEGVPALPATPPLGLPLGLPRLEWNPSGETMDAGEMARLAALIRNQEPDLASTEDADALPADDSPTETNLETTDETIMDFAATQDAPVAPSVAPSIPPITQTAPKYAGITQEAPVSPLASVQEAPPVPRAPESQSRAPESQPRAPESQPRVPESQPRAAAPLPPPPQDPAELAKIGKLAPLPSFSRAETLKSLAIMGEKAMLTGRGDEAERILQRGLLDVLDGVRRREVSAETIQLAAALGAKLAAATGSGRWFDYAISLYAEIGDVAPGPVVDLLYAAVPRVKTIQKAAFRAYVAGLRTSPADSPARRFLLQRIDGLKRVVEQK